MYECKEIAERQSKDRRRVEGLSAVDELFALFCDVYLAYVDSQYVATISKKAQRTHEEGEKNLSRERGYLCMWLQLRKNPQFWGLWGCRNVGNFAAEIKTAIIWIKN